MSGAWYNEIDPYAADWLEALIRAGHIAPGVVDRRSIVDVHPRELAEFTQCHFFAGIGVWSYALRRAGWPDDRRVWTGSCPCQPFSAAGKGDGFADERHLWPALYYLIEQCRPPVVLGEQVASKDGLAWLDLVQADLEAAGYAAGAVDLCAAGVGAPHIRQRLWFVANADGWHAGAERQQPGREHGQQSQDGGVGLVANSSSTRLEGSDARSLGRQLAAAQRSGEVGSLADDGAGLGEQRGLELLDSLWAPQRDDTYGCGADDIVGDATQRRQAQGSPPCSEPERQGHGPDDPSLLGFWSDAEWIPCRDGKWRPVESRHEPLADGVAARMGYVRSGEGWTLSPLIVGAENRVGRLRAYGNAIVAPAAEAWIRTVMECIDS